MPPLLEYCFTVLCSLPVELFAIQMSFPKSRVAEVINTLEFNNTKSAGT